jgi:sigma-B regulation protein RsbU (phosphoserine phosphatase)
MVMTQAAVRALKETREADPVRFLDTLNRTLYHNVQRMHSDKNLTLALLTYMPGCVSISGQHEEIVIVRRGGSVERINTMDLGFPLGLEADIAPFIRHISVELQPGDGVVLYTDGITEAADIKQRQYGVERLCTVISQHWAGMAHEIQAAVIADVRCHIGMQKVFDDITLVVVKQR